jgi:hypothetical protein
MNRTRHRVKTGKAGLAKDRTGAAMRAKRGVSYISFRNTTRYCVLTPDIQATYKHTNRKRKVRLMMATAKVKIETERGTVELEFKDMQQAMERMGAANLETLRQWVQGLERKAMAANQRE